MTKVLTPARRARLEKLAAYLEALPADYRHFGMSFYVTGAKDTDRLRKYALHNGGVQHCGTAACAVGHGPAAGILMPRKIAALFGEESLVKPWMEYSKLFVGTDPDFPEHASPGPFEWLFGEDWEHVDNSHYGAAARIRYFLDKGLPDDFERGACGYGWVDMVPLYDPYRIDAEAPTHA